MRNFLSIFTVGIFVFLALVGFGVALWFSSYIGFENKIPDEKISLKKIPVILLSLKYDGLTKGFLYDDGVKIVYKTPSKIFIQTETVESPLPLGKIKDKSGEIVVSSSANFTKENALVITLGVSPKLKNNPDAEKLLNTSLWMTFFELSHQSQDLSFNQLFTSDLEKLQKSNFLFYPLIRIKH